MNEYKNLLEKFPNSQLGHYNFALLLLKYNEPCEAKNHLTKAVEIDPSTPTGIAATEKLKLTQCK